MIVSTNLTAVDQARSGGAPAGSDTRRPQVSACGLGAVHRRRTNPYPAVRLTATVVGAPAAVAVAGGSAAAEVSFVALVLLLEWCAGRQCAVLPSALDEVRPFAVRTVAAAAIVVAAGLPFSTGSTDRDRAFDLAPMLVAAACVVLTMAGRAAGYAWIRRLHSMGRAGEPAVVVGAGAVGARLVARLREHPEYGLRPVGFIDSAARAAPRGLPVPVLGGTGDLPRLLTRHRIRRVIVAFGTVPDNELVQALRACERLDCEIYVVPRLFELASSGNPDAEHVWGLPCVRLPRAPFRAPAWRVKRILDVVVAGAGLIALVPVLLLIALAVRLEVGAGVFFRQERIGLDGRPFSLVKFRTLRPAAGAPEGWSVVAHERMGPVGRFLRRTSLDELPQLWNVLLGQMSLVGPRPELPRYAEIFAETHPRYADRLRVPAGVTGLAQVVGLRGNTSLEERVQFDNFYIEHWSLWRDIKIIARTIGSVLLMRGA